MSQENVETLRTGFDAFNRGDEEAWIAVYHDDAELADLEGMPDAQTYHGHHGARQWLANVRGTMDGLRFEPRSFREEGDTVLVEAAASGSGSGSGVPVEWIAYFVFSFRSGKIATSRAFLNERDALEAAGLSE
jgi:ketosteroid isomerase-like protein